MIQAHDRFGHYRQPPVASGSEPPHDDGMEHRVTALETRLDTILPTLATKTDIEGVRGDIKGWMLATTLTIIGTMVATLVVLFHSSSPSSSPSNAPIVIQVPYPAQPVQTQAPPPQAAKHN